MRGGMRRPLVVLLVFAPACTCGKKSQESTGADAAVATTESAPSGFVASGPARFSKPIAAAHAADGAVLVAGLVASEKAIVVTRVEQPSTATFSVPILRNVGWTAD